MLIERIAANCISALIENGCLNKLVLISTNIQFGRRVLYLFFPQQEFRLQRQLRQQNSKEKKII